MKTIKLSIRLALFVVALIVVAMVWAAATTVELLSPKSNNEV